MPACLHPPPAQATLEERLAPLAFLNLLHPHRPAAAAAHQVFCALLVALPEGRREPLAAYYVRRSLEGCPAGAPPPPELGQGLATVLAWLPLGSAVPLLCLQEVLGACMALAARCAGAGQGVVWGWQAACMRRWSCCAAVGMQHGLVWHGLEGLE